MPIPVIHFFMSLDSNNSLEVQNKLTELILGILDRYKHVLPVTVREYLRFKTGIRKVKSKPTESFDDFARDDSSLNFGSNTDIRKIDETINTDDNLTLVVNTIAEIVKADVVIDNAKKNDLLLVLNSLLRFVNERREVYAQVANRGEQISVAVDTALAPAEFRPRFDQTTPVVQPSIDHLRSLAPTVDVPTIDIDFEFDNTDFDDDDSRDTPVYRKK